MVIISIPAHMIRAGSNTVRHLEIGETSQMNGGAEKSCTWVVKIPPLPYPVYRIREGSNTMRDLEICETSQMKCGTVKSSAFALRDLYCAP